ncbi:MAG TPA: carbonic anhydrase, partial [Candidatus Sulfotelmatobacter sp.]|nr:carbonic anhydrase [Candidatus Sulfotelmatobacter sp.]
RRNIANVIHTGDMNILSVLTFAIDHLKVEHVIVCGHYGCGGVRHALAGGADGLLASWLQPIAMLHRRHRATFDAIADEPARIDRMCEINVEMQVRRLAATPTVEHAWARGRAVHLHGWVYGIQDGLLRDLGPHLSSIAERDALAPVVGWRCRRSRSAPSDARRSRPSAGSRRVRGFGRNRDGRRIG